MDNRQVPGSSPSLGSIHLVGVTGELWTVVLLPAICSPEDSVSIRLPASIMQVLRVAIRDNLTIKRQSCKNRCYLL